MIKLKPRELYVQWLCTIDILTLKSIIFRKTGEVFSDIKVGVIFISVYFFQKGGAIIGDRAVIRSFTVLEILVHNGYFITCLMSCMSQV